MRLDFEFRFVRRKKKQNSRECMCDSVKCVKLTAQFDCNWFEVPYTGKIDMESCLVMIITC